MKAEQAAVKVNNIGVPGQQGFGIGVCPGPLPEGMSGMADFNDPASDFYGNYTYLDGSVMVWIPAFYYKIGTGENGEAKHFIDVVPTSFFEGIESANSAGYALHRAFYDGGKSHTGVFVDKFLCSDNYGVASSLKNGKPLSTYSGHNPIGSLQGKPTNAYFGTIQAAKTRGLNFFVNSRFIFSALALLSVAHGQAPKSTEFCGWFSAEYNHPKGCNTGLRDVRDSDVIYQGDGYGTCGLTGSGSEFNRTTHNGQNSGVADLNGLMWEVSPGITFDGENYRVIHTEACMKDLTAGITKNTDLWGSKGIKNNYELLLPDSEFELEDGYSRYGYTLNTLSEESSGTGWKLTGLGIALAGGDPNPALSGYFWNYPSKGMCPISGGTWNNGSNAGVWAFNLSDGRGNSNSDVGFRSALYL